MSYLSAIAAALVSMTPCDVPPATDTSVPPIHPDEQAAHAKLKKLDCRFATIHVGNYSRVTGIDLSGFATSNATKEMAEEFVELVRAFPELTIIKIWYVPLTERGYRMIGQVRGLEELDLDLCTGNADWLVHLKACGKLRVLKLGRQLIGEKGISAIGGFTQLKELSMRINSNEEPSLQALSNLTELQSLRFTTRSENVKRLSFLKPLLQLRELHLSAPGITDEAVTDLGECHDLRILRFENCPKLTDKSLEPIGRFKHLRELSGMRFPIPDHKLVLLKDLTEMQVLALNVIEVTGHGLVHLKEMKSLRNLGLGGTYMTNDRMVELNQFRALNVLSLGPLVTDAGLPALHGLRNLRYIYAQNISQAACIKRLEEMNKAPERP